MTIDEAIAETLEMTSRFAERNLIWCLVNEPSASVSEVAAIVEPDDFRDRMHGEVFRWMRKMAQTRGYDFCEMVDAMVGSGKTDLALHASRILGQPIEHGAPQPWRIQRYAQQVRERAQHRRLVDIADAERLALSGHPARLPDGSLIEGHLPVDEVIALTTAARRRLTKGNAGAAISAPLKAFRDRALEQQEVSALPFGLTALDQLLRGGARGGQLIIVGGRPAMGKTAFLMGAVVSWIQAGQPGVVFSLEMGGGELYQRLLANRSELQVDAWDQDWDRVLNAADEIDGWRIHIADAAGLTLEAIRAECERRHAEGSLKWILVDYLTLMGTDPNIRDHHLKVGANATGLKAIAKEFDIPVLLACQLNRDLEKRKDKRPVPADLRDAGQIEQDADVIICLYREVVYDPTYDGFEAEIIVGKQRGGPTGNVLATWNGELTRFEDRMTSPLSNWKL
jgi:replicative DNA helicase